MPSNHKWLDRSYPCFKRQILDSSELKELENDNFIFDQNGRKFSKNVENAVETREIARYEQFPLFPQCFKKMVLQTRKNQGMFGKWLQKT